jgi:hypothetical protein
MQIMGTATARKRLALAFVGTTALTTSAAQTADPLPSWNDGQAKQAILNFVD